MKILLTVVAMFLLVGCNAPSAPSRSGNHKSQTLSDISGVDLLTLLRVEYHIGNNITVKGNEGLKKVGNLR